MLRKILSVILALSLTLGMLVIPNSAASKDNINEGTPVVKETKTEVSSELEVDGSVVKCVYEKQEEDYALFLDEQRYDLGVTKQDGYTFIYFEDEENPLFEDGVVGQSALALTSWYWGPAVVAAAKTVIAYTVKITAVAVGTYISAEAIAETIYQVKTKSLTKSNVKTKAGVRALDMIKYAPKSYGNYYYEAYLLDDMVMLGRQINEFTAVSRLRQGKDVFAGSRIAAFTVASKASVGGYAKEHSPHSGSGDMFPHFHATGRKWVMNRKHQPHCWFPV